MPLERGRLKVRNRTKQSEELHSLEISDRRLGAPGSKASPRLLPDLALDQIESASSESSSSTSSLSDNDSSESRPSITRPCQSQTALSDADESSPNTGKGYASSANSSSGEIAFESKTLEACSSSATLLQSLCDKLIESLKDTWSHINKIPTLHSEIDRSPDHRDFRDSTNRMGLQNPTHPINALNIQQLDLANIIKLELVELKFAAGR